MWSLNSGVEHVDRPENHNRETTPPQGGASQGVTTIDLDTWGGTSNRDQQREVADAWGSPRVAAAELQQEHTRDQQAGSWLRESDQVENNNSNSWGQQQQARRESGGGASGLSALESAARNSARSRSSTWEGSSSSTSSQQQQAHHQQQQQQRGREGTGYAATGSMSSGAPCGACKFLRRKCVRGCIFAPYFGAEQGAARFAAVHKIFGASNVAKLLLHIPVPRRCDAVLTISYEAQARLSDPVYGCVATIFALQQQVASLQAELAMVQAQLVGRQAAAHQIHQHQHQHHPAHHHHLHQQHEQIGTMSPGSVVPSSAYMQQQHEHSQLSPSDISMSMPSGSGSGAGGYPGRVKEEGNSFLGMQHYGDLGMGSSSGLDQHNSLLDSLHKPRSEHMDQGSEQDGELQALASLLRRK